MTGKRQGYGYQAVKRLAFQQLQHFFTGREIPQAGVVRKKNVFPECAVKPSGNPHHHCRPPNAAPYPPPGIRAACPVIYHLLERVKSNPVYVYPVHHIIKRASALPRTNNVYLETLRCPILRQGRPTVRPGMNKGEVPGSNDEETWQGLTIYDLRFMIFDL